MIPVAFLLALTLMCFRAIDLSINCRLKVHYYQLYYSVIISNNKGPKRPILTPHFASKTVRFSL